ncbi:MAG: SDR family oxidoreductase [Streptosporangiales bacterium]
MTGTQVAIITGASRGLGLALTEELSRAGWAVVVDGRNAAALHAAVGGLDGVRAVPGDVTDDVHRDALVTEAERLGGPHLLVNNAGVLGPSPQPTLADYPSEVLREVLESNLVAPLALARRVLPALRGNGGAIVNITSDAAAEAMEGWGGYGAAKAGLEHASAVLAAEEPRVRVWWVDPGDLRTQMHQEAFPDEDISDRALPATVTPAFVRLVTERPASGRYRTDDLLTGAPA